MIDPIKDIAAKLTDDPDIFSEARYRGYPGTETGTTKFLADEINIPASLLNSSSQTDKNHDGGSFETSSNTTTGSIYDNLPDEDEFAEYCTVIFVVDYTYWPPEPRTRHYPGSPHDLELYNVDVQSVACETGAVSLSQELVQWCKDWFDDNIDDISQEILSDIHLNYDPDSDY
jgi:hypothetical protein